MAATLTQSCTVSAEEYLALEAESDVRHEFRNGEIVSMTGGTFYHNKIAVLLMALLVYGPQRKSYEVGGGDLRLWIPDRDMYAYPDVIVMSRPVQFKQGRSDIVTNPLFIAEVLSNSTKSYDRGEKFFAYRSLPSLQDYLLIDQYSPHVEHYSKQDSHQWLLTEYDGLDAELTLSSLGVQISLSDLYEDVEFPAPDPKPPETENETDRSATDQ